MKERTSKVAAAAYYVSCPYCDADIPEPRTGSLMWTPYDADQCRGFPMDCPACGRRFMFAVPVRLA